LNRGFARVDAALEISAHIDLDQHAERRTGLAGGGVQITDVLLIVDTDGNRPVPTETGESLKLGGPPDLVREEDVLDASFDHDLGFADLLAAHSHGAALHLAKCDSRGLVRLGVRSKGHRR
jgi:hypothetical protein